jgi:hypothetical protein
MPDQTLKSISEALAKGVIARHGCPRDLQGDQGPQIKAMEEAARLLGINMHFVATSHQQANGKPEREIQFIKDQIATRVNVSQDDWDEHLDFIRFAVVSTPIPWLRASPFEMDHGRKPRMIADLLLPDRDEKIPPESYARIIRQRLREARKQFINFDQQQLDRAKNKYNLTHRASKLQVGDRVLLYRHRRNPIPGLARKLCNKWQGPMTIVERTSKSENVTFKLKDERGVIFEAHAKHIIRFNGDQTLPSVAFDTVEVPSLLINKSQPDEKKPGEKKKRKSKARKNQEEEKYKTEERDELGNSNLEHIKEDLWTAIAHDEDRDRWDIAQVIEANEDPDTAIVHYYGTTDVKGAIHKRKFKPGWWIPGSESSDATFSVSKPHADAQEYTAIIDVDRILLQGFRLTSEGTLNKETVRRINREHAKSRRARPRPKVMLIKRDRLTRLYSPPCCEPALASNCAIKNDPRAALESTSAVQDGPSAAENVLESEAFK